MTCPDIGYSMPRKKFDSGKIRVLILNVHAACLDPDIPPYFRFSKEYGFVSSNIGTMAQAISHSEWRCKATLFNNRYRVLNKKREVHSAVVKMKRNTYLLMMKAFKQTMSLPRLARIQRMMTRKGMMITVTTTRSGRRATRYLL